MGSCNSVEDHSTGGVRISTSGSHLDLVALEGGRRNSADDTPPQLPLESMPHPVGDQEATPTFNLAAALAGDTSPGKSPNAKAKADLQKAGELCGAALEGDVEELKKLLSAGYNVNAGDYDRRTAIHIAASEGREEAVTVLLAHKADPTVVDRWGHTPLDEAIRGGHPKAAALLRSSSKELGAARLTSSAFERQTSDMEQAAMLCAAAATAWVPQLEKLLKGRADPGASDYDGRTALHIAASRGHAEVVRILLRAKANPMAHDSFGKTPVDEAIQHNSTDVIAAFAESGAQVLTEAAGQNSDFEALKTMAASEHWSIIASEVSFGKCLSTTIKSAVYLATWRGLKVVAKTVKDFKSTGLNTRGAQASESTVKIARDELLHEIRTLSTLRHPDLVLFLGASLDTDVCFFLTEYMEGGDVETYMKSNRIKSNNREFKPPYHVALSWSLSTARALAFLHGCARPIIHRDLKPLNLLLTKGLDLKVTDFGLSKIMRPKLLDRTGTDVSPAPQMSGGVGTYRYMAPEVVRYEQYTDRIDIYALALIMYYIFSGKMPFFDFCGDDPEKVLRAYLKGQEPRPTLCSSCGPAELRQLFQDAWAVKAEDRPSAQDCVDRLEKLPAGKPSRMFGLF
mmetsp:Transcript_73050/g.171307  ORF Transcript_73050/g.171307 Transcript_73050/m.171307 type:complete len:626 (-) Transcript_73050:144-2021(-)